MHTELTAADRTEIAEALYRLGAGIDENSAALLESAVTADAQIDFGPAARTMGIDFPLLSGRDQIVSTLTATVGLLDTTHVVSNPRVEFDGERVVLKAIVEAAHFPPGDHSRRCIMKNRYVAEVRQELGRWKLAAVEVRCAWFDGDPAVLLGK
jgi:SnoaL-like domain